MSREKRLAAKPTHTHEVAAAEGMGRRDGTGHTGKKKAGKKSFLIRNN